MHIVVASSSAYRQALYRDAISALGYEVVTANGGVECIERLRDCSVALLLLEAPLLWGGSDGVLDIVQHQMRASPPVIVVAVGSGSIDWFQLSRFRVDDFLFRVPTAHELERAISVLLDGTRNRRGEAGRQPGLPHWPAVPDAAHPSQHAWIGTGSNLSPKAESN
jgi:DNA-binding response OmpR family regulator